MAVGDTELAFEIVGARRPGLVFLHEGLGSIELWRGFPHRIAEQTGETALVYDRSGHGRSSPMRSPRTARYLHEAALEELAGLFERIDITDPILIGHSDGATIALLYAARHPVAGLGLIAPHVYVEPAAIAGIERTDREAEMLIGRLEPYHDRARDLYTAWRDIWLDAGFADWDITEEIRGMDTPMLLLQGTRDEYGTLEQLERIEAAATGRAERVVIEGAGHSPHLTHAGETEAAVAGFIRSVRRGGAGPT